jgi:hypothetical protein
LIFVTHMRSSLVKDSIKIYRDTISFKSFLTSGDPLKADPADLG